MSFEEINESNSIVIDGRACIILYNFSDKELKAIKNVGVVFGVSDFIILNSKNAGTYIKDVINGEFSEKSEEFKNDKTIMFNAIPSKKLNLLIDSIKKLKFPNPLMAVITETSMGWTVNTLIDNLREERLALKSGKKLNH